MILPQRALFNLDDPLHFSVSHKESCIEGEMIVLICKNYVTIDFTSQEKIQNFNTLKNLVTDFVATITDLVSINCAFGYYVDISSIYDMQEKITRIFGFDIPELSDIKNFEQRTIDIAPMLTSLFSPKNEKKNPSTTFIQSSLSDFKEAILRPKDTGLHCYRALESIINFFMEDKKINDKKKAIGELGKLLNIDDSCFNKLRSLNILVRHGNPVWISGKDRVTAMRIVREIILRFLVYLDIDHNSPPNFPLEKLNGVSELGA